MQVQAGQQIEVIVRVRNGQSVQVENIVVRSVLPVGLTYVPGSTTIAGTPTAVDAVTSAGIALGALVQQSEVTIVFRVNVVAASFVVGTTQTKIDIIANATDTAQQTASLSVVVTRTAAAIPGAVQTGPGDAVWVALLISAIMTLLYVSYTHTVGYRRREIDAITHDRDPMDFRS